ncbi:hypothetical protein J4216_06555 [Candidatus Woesearchaeota archaeon]|nr:hypothetical protein [Candidatus Woesearchaeota archaeon]
MKIKSLITIFTLSLLLILSSCTGSGGKKVSGTGFIGGQEGITSSIEIQSTTGGNQIFDKNIDPFKIQINLQNKGEDDVETNEILVSLDGINFNAFQINPSTKSSSIPLKGIRKEAGKVTDPTQTIIQFDANYKPDEAADTSKELSANICYKYQTKSRVEDLCLRKKITGPTQSSDCKVDEVKTAQNSGSPFKVKTFSERPAGENKINIFIEAENIGPGTIYSKEFLSKGSCLDEQNEKNKIYVKVDLTDFENDAAIISCSGLNKNEGSLNVIQNKVQLSCDIDTSSFQESTFETSINVIFDYVYKDAVSTTLTIKSST